MKKLSLVLALVLLFVLTGSCFAEDLKIGFMTYSDEQEFNITVGESVKAACEAEGIPCLMQTTGQDVTVIRSVFDSYVQQGCNVIVDFSVMPEVSMTLADQCAKKGIYHICVDTDAGENSYFYGLDNAFAGDVLGRGVANYISANLEGEVDKIIVLCSSILGEAVYARTENAVEILLAEFPEFNRDMVHYIDLVDFDLTSVKQQILDYFTTCGEDETLVMMSFSSGFSSCAYAAANSANKEDTLHYFACDGLQETIKLFKSGEPTVNKGEVCSFPSKYGADIVELAKRLVAGEEVGRLNYVENEFMTPENVFEIFPD